MQILPDEMGAMQPIGVECVFGKEGDVQVRRVQINIAWIPVGQGRQWLDDDGRHVLIMLPNNQVRELILSPDALVWQLKPTARNRQLL